MGFCEGYVASSSSKGKGVQVDKVRTEGVSSTQSTRSPLANEDESDSAIKDFDNFSDREFDEGAAVKVEEEAIEISSDDDGVRTYV